MVTTEDIKQGQEPQIRAQSKDPNSHNSTFSKDQTGSIRIKRPKPHSNHKQGKSKVRPT